MKKWKESDFIDGAIFRENNEFVEVYMVDTYTGIRGYTIVHGLLRLEEINLKEVLESFDCTSLSELKADLGDDWERDAILAWFQMDCRNDPDAYRVCREPFGSYGDAAKQMHLMAGYKRKQPIKWWETSTIKDAIFRKYDEFMEIYKVDTFSTGYCIYHGLVRFEDIDFMKIFQAFDYTTVEDIKADSGSFWMQDAMLMWFEIDCRTGGNAYMVRQDPFDSYEEAIQQMRRMAGCQEDADAGGLDISRILMASTAHISPGTAELLDEGDAGDLISYPKDGGYFILAVGWEDYGDGTPSDLMDCAKFAAEHGCDWLCLDGEAGTVPGLPIYEWPD